MNSETILVEELEKQLESQAQMLSALKDENNRLKAEAILAQKKIEESLFLKNIIAVMPGNVFWKDTKGYYLGCNNNIAKFCRLNSPDEIIGKHDRDLHVPEVERAITAADQEILRSDQIKYFEEYGLDENQVQNTFLSQKMPLKDLTGKTIGILGISLNITERKKMEEDLKIAKEKAEAANQAKSQFLAVVNHELRTPLASIVGLVNFLKRGELSPKEGKKIIQNIDNCTKHLMSLVDDVLDFSRLEAGKFDSRIQPVNLDPLLKEICGMLIGLAEEKNILLIIENDKRNAINVLTDARVLRQILINLITNAIKFTEKGKVVVRAMLTPLPQQKVRLNLMVIDSGPGIPEDKLEAIFEPFQQLDNAYTRQSSRGGTGLGLAIVKKLALLINGDLKVTSKVGVGSTFSLIAEMEKAKEEDQVASVNKPEAKQPTPLTPIYPDQLSYKPLILLIEDDPIIQFIHKKMLVDLGCEVVTALSGHEAIQKLTTFDMIFVDISLPDISGFEVIRTIRTLYPEHQFPIVALTAYNGKEEKAASLNAGANTFKTKPISLKGLRKILLKYLKETRVI